ncbi:hypothetical protein DFH27DRAFT_639650 [Peziza echinospora]|nr:hypothetical protein DFH27DRAFT_639650 [Peziza echinospora]
MCACGPSVNVSRSTCPGACPAPASPYPDSQYHLHNYINININNNNDDDDDDDTKNTHSHAHKPHLVPPPQPQPQLQPKVIIIRQPAAPLTHTHTLIQAPSLTVSDVERLVRLDPEAEHVVMPCLSLEQFEAGKDLPAGPQIFSEQTTHQSSVLRTMLEFRPHDSIKDVGDMLVKCHPSPYHETACRAIWREAEQGVFERLGGNHQHNACLRYAVLKEYKGFTPTATHHDVRVTATRMPVGAITPAPDPRAPMAGATCFPTLTIEACAASSRWHCSSTWWRQSPRLPRRRARANSRPQHLSIAGQPPSCPTHQLPSEASYDDTLYALRDWYDDMDILGLLTPALVGPVEGTLHVYRKRQGGNGEATLDSKIHFMTRVTPIPNATITLRLADVYGPDHAVTRAPTPLQQPQGVEINFTRMADEIVLERDGMQWRRAFDHAELVLRKHHKASTHASDGPPTTTTTTTSTTTTLPARPILVDITQNAQDNAAATVPPENYVQDDISAPRKWKQIKRDKLETDQALDESEEEEAEP